MALLGLDRPCMRLHVHHSLRLEGRENFNNVHFLHLRLLAGHYSLRNHTGGRERLLHLSKRFGYSKIRQ